MPKTWLALCEWPTPTPRTMRLRAALVERGRETSLGVAELPAVSQHLRTTQPHDSYPGEGVDHRRPVVHLVDAGELEFGAHPGLTAQLDDAIHQNPGRDSGEVNTPEP